MTAGNEHFVVTEQSILAEFPGWSIWQGIEGLWHARIKGATPPVIVTGEDLTDLRDQIRGYEGREG